MADYHTIGISRQSMGPLDGCGSVIGGLPVVSGCCDRRFVVEEDVITLGSSVYSMRQPDFNLTCPYCSRELPVRATSLRLSEVDMPTGAYT